MEHSRLAKKDVVIVSGPIYLLIVTPAFFFFFNLDTAFPICVIWNFFLNEITVKCVLNIHRKWTQYIEFYYFGWNTTII